MSWGPRVQGHVQSIINSFVVWVVSRPAERKQNVYYPRVSAEAEDVCYPIRGFGHGRFGQRGSPMKLSGIRECREVGDSENRACEISLARLSPRLLRRREFMRHLFVVDSLDKQMQNEKELIRLASAGVGGLFCICVESINLT